MANGSITPWGSTLTDTNAASSILPQGITLTIAAVAPPPSDPFFENKVDQISCGEKLLTASQLNGVLVT